MKAFFTHTPWPLRPPGRRTLSLLPFLLFLLLPAWSVAQNDICFDGLTAGASFTACPGDLIALDGGYADYDDADDPDSGTPSVTWENPFGGGTDPELNGEFFIDGVGVGIGLDVTAENFNNSLNGVTNFSDITYQLPTTNAYGPLFLVGFEIIASSTNGDCQTANEALVLYVDPFQEAVIDVTVDGSTEIDQAGSDGNGTADNDADIASGDDFTLEITNAQVFQGGTQVGDLLVFDYTISGADDVGGLPADGTGISALDINNLFDDLTIDNLSCEEQTFTVSFEAYYERNGNGAPECRGEMVILEFTLAPRPEPTATIGAVDDILIVCEDDEDVEVVVTGTPFTKVTYTVSYDGGATVPAGPEMLELDATGTSFAIMLDANDGAAGQDIVITLIEQEFLNGPPCPVTISKPLTIEVEALPTLSVALLNPEDAVICNVQNGGPLSVTLVLSTTSGEGFYTFTALEFADDDLVNTNEDLTFFFADPDGDGIATAGGTLTFEDPVPDGTVMTYRVVGTTITKEGPDPDCENDAPDAEVSILIQKESYLVAEINDSEGGTITLSDYSGSEEGDVIDAEVTFCDGEVFTLDVIDPTANNAFADIVGSEALFNVEIMDPNGVLTTAVAGIYDFDAPFSVNQILDIDNSDTDPSSFTITLTPFMDNDGDGAFNADGSTDDCLGNPVSVTVNVLPAPSVSVLPLPEDICEGKSVDIVITASETGLASLLLPGGGSIELPITEGDANGEGGFTITYNSGPLSTGNFQFTVTTFVGDDADCSATVNQMVMTDAEPLPEASVAADISVCDDEDATITFTGTEGNGTGFTFTYSISSNGGTPVSASVSTDGTDATIDVTFESGDLPAGETVISLVSVANNGGLECVNDAEGSVSILVEDEPIVSCDADDELICSGDDYSFTLTAGSDEESAIGNTLYYSVTTSVTTTVSTGAGSTDETEESTEIVLGDEGGVTISGSTENMSGFNQTVEISVTPFYFDDSDGEPTEIGDACTGETLTCSVTVKTMPMVTFGGNDAVCEGGSGTLVFTGPPGGRAAVFITDSEGSTDLGFIFFTDGGSLFVPYEDIELSTTISLVGVSDGPVFNPNTCFAEGDFEFTINVTPSPEAEFDEEGATVCEGDITEIALTGTPFAQVSIDSDNDVNDQIVSLDENGEGSLTVTADEDENFTVTEIALTTEDGNGDDFTCTADGDDSFELTVNPAPDGALMTNAILCAGESPQVQFNIINDVAGPFTIFVNDVEFNEIMSGDVLDFTGTDFETLATTTLFTLQSILEEGEGLVCGDLFDVEPTVLVVVNPIPEATAGETPEEICSGDELQLSVTGTPAEGAEENALMFEVTANNAIGTLAAGESITVDAAGAADLNTTLGLTGPFINGSTIDPESVSLTILPFFEGGTGTGSSEDCATTEGFIGDFVEANWVTESGSESSVTFTNSTLTLFGADDDGGLPESETNASASYLFTQDGTVSFDMLIELENGSFGGGGSGEAIFDIFLITFEGNIVYNSQLEQEINASFSQMVTSNTTLLLLLDDDEEIFDVDDSQVTISNFLFEPACSRCEGSAVNIDFDILPALFADFDPNQDDIRICEGESTEICLLGTANSEISLSLGNGSFTTVKTDPITGEVCFDVGPLTTGRTIILTGITTLDPALPECGFTFPAAERPRKTINVTPTPEVTVEIDPAEVCAGEMASATITSDSDDETEVFYTISTDPDSDDDDINGSVVLEDGEGDVNLSTVNEGLENVEVTIALTSVNVTIDGVTCTTELTEDEVLIVRPLPNGDLTNDGPVCDGDEVNLIFTATTPLQPTYTLIVTGPDGAFDGEPQPVEFTDVVSGESFFSTDVAGEYSVLVVTDGVGTDVSCSSPTDAEEPISSTTVVIEAVPQLAASITGTVGSAEIATDDPDFMSFVAVACDQATIATEFTTSTPMDSEGNDLAVQVTITQNDGSMIDLPTPSTFVVALADLDLSGIFSNVVAPDNANISLELTPFFESDGDVTTLADEECAGGVLTFDITILPAVEIAISPAPTSTDEVCEGDAVSIVLTGTPGAEVTFSTTNLTDVSASPITIGADGTATIMATGGDAGAASVDISMVLLESMVGDIDRTCMLLFEPGDLDFDITINEVPEAMVMLDKDGPICNGESVEVSTMLMNTAFEVDGSFTFRVNGTLYCSKVDEDGKIVLFNSGPLTETTTFELTSAKNDDTGCELNDGTILSTVTIMVEDVPDGSITGTTSNGDVDTAEDGSAAEFTICANDGIDFDAVVNSGAVLTAGAASYVSVVVNTPLDFFGLGTGESTVAIPVEDFAADFSRNFNMISGSPVTVTLDATFYNETAPGEGASLDDEECDGTTVSITITINPNPKTEDVMTMICSGEDLAYDLDDAIVNHLVGATFSYTVTTDNEDLDVSGLDRDTPSSDPVTDVFENLTDATYTVTYTVTPFGAEGCQGNDFELVVTVKPEPVITEGQTVEACSGEETLCIILLDNETDQQTVPGTIQETDMFEVISITYSLESDDFIIDDDNAEEGDVGGFDVIAFDVFTNLSSEAQTVTYVVQGTSEEGCVGAEETIVVTILPEPVVADMVMKVCSGGSIELGFDELTENGVGDILSFVRTAGPAVTLLRIFDETGADVTGDAWFGGSPSNPHVDAINDSYLNTGTGTLSVFYAVSIAVQGEGELVCEPETFMLEVQVVEEADVVLELAGESSNICAGEPITLQANYDGSGTDVEYVYSYTSEDGVELHLEPSLSGAEVVVSAVSGSGIATVMVMVTDDNSCVAMSTRPVGVGETPEEMDIDGFEDPCVGGFAFYSITPTEGSTYLWSLSNPAAGTFTNNPATGPNTSITFNDTQGFGPFEVMVTETSAEGCSTTSSLSVTLFEGTTADFNAEEDGTDPLTFNFTELAGGSIETYMWDFGDGSEMNFEQNPTHTYEQDDETAQMSYTVTLTVFGCDGSETASKVITTNSTAETDVIELERGVNFISFDVAPADNSIRSVFANMPDLVRVVTVDGSVPTSFQPELPNFRNSLSTIEPGFGYVVIMDEAATMTVTGEPIDDAFLRPTGMGINYVACIPEGPTDAATAWLPYTSDNTLNFARTFGNNLFNATGDFVQTYTPGLPAFRQSMTDVFNGHGYMIIRSDVVGRAAPTSSSEDYEFVHGRVAGLDFNAGDVVEILNENEEVIGHVTTDQTGNFSSTAIFGKVEREDGALVGSLEEGEEVSFRYNGQTIKPGLYYRGGFNGTEVNLNFDDVSTTDLSVVVMPNPAVDRTTVMLELSEDAEITVRAMDATGRMVRELMPAQKLSAGSTSIEWTNMNALPAGLYHVVVLYEGQLLPELTQRVVKH